MREPARFWQPRPARRCARVSVASERRGTAALRARVLAHLTGKVIEVGGCGRNLRHYPPTVYEIVAVEPDHRLARLAEQAARALVVPTRVVAAPADDLPFGTEIFDVAVVTLVLCTVPDPRRVLAELYRVVKPGGRLRFLEHVRSTHPAIAAGQTLITPLCAAAGGCRLDRDTAADIRAAGFVIDQVDRVYHRPLPHLPKHAHIIGHARKPPHAARPPSSRS